MEHCWQTKNGMNIFRAGWKGMDMRLWIVRRKFSWSAADLNILSTACSSMTWCTFIPVMLSRTSSCICTRKTLKSQEAARWKHSLGCKWSRLLDQSRLISITISRKSWLNVRDTWERNSTKKAPITLNVVLKPEDTPDLLDHWKKKFSALLWQSFSSQPHGSDSILHLLYSTWLSFVHQLDLRIG